MSLKLKVSIGLLVIDLIFLTAELIEYVNLPKTIIVSLIGIPLIVFFFWDYFKRWVLYFLPPYPSNMNLLKLHLQYKKYDGLFVDKIRDSVKNAKMKYLLPIEKSCHQWGNLIEGWHGKFDKIHEKDTIRWSLFSDYYLRQENVWFKDSRFATDLDLYAKTILLNFYLSVDPDNILPPPLDDTGYTHVIWVFSKQIPTDWPLCEDDCYLTPNCITGDEDRDSEKLFLKQYMTNLQAAAHKASDGPNFEFNRHILVMDTGQEYEEKGFKSNEQLLAALNSHWDLYHKSLHKHRGDETFSNSYRISLDKVMAKAWPDMLNDAVLYGYYPHGTSTDGEIEWEWAICTTFLPNHPTILLDIDDLTKNEGKDSFESKIDNFCTYINENGENNLKTFTKWILKLQDSKQKNKLQDLLEEGKS